MAAQFTYAYSYDCAGNATTRTVGSSTYTFTYNEENQLTAVSGAATGSFGYDGDGRRVKATVAGTTPVYIGDHYEWTGSTSTAKRYYFAGAQRVAMRTGTGTVQYLIGDHPGSTSLTLNSTGGLVAEIRYTAWGESRYTSGTTPTARHYTGQIEENGLGGLYFYNARWYEPSVGRFLQADTVVPGAGNQQALNRYVYTGNNPLKFADPSGHCHVCVGAVVGGVVNAGLYLWNEAQHGDGFQVNSGQDWLDLTVAAGMGAAAGALVTVNPAAGINMAVSLAVDHAVNAVTGTNFDGLHHGISGTAGALIGAANSAVTYPAAGQVIGAGLAKTVVKQSVNAGVIGAVAEGLEAGLRGEAADIARMGSAFAINTAGIAFGAAALTGSAAAATRGALGYTDDLIRANMSSISRSAASDFVVSLGLGAFRVVANAAQALE